MKLSQLRALVAVAKYGNFSEAALELNLSQPAISHAIASLEEELGVILFSRGRYGAMLTTAGEKIVTHASESLENIEDIYKEANRQKGFDGGEVRVASFRSVATHILPRVIVEFAQAYPHIGVTIMERFDYVNIEQCLRQGQADLGITYLPTSEEFEAWELFRDEYLVLLPPKPRVCKNQITWEDLESYGQIMLACLPCARILHTHMKKVAPHVPTRSDIQEDSTIVGLVRQGLGAAILPRLAAEPIPKEIQVFSLPEPEERVIGVAMLSKALHTPAVFAFLDVLKSFDLSR